MHNNFNQKHHSGEPTIKSGTERYRVRLFSQILEQTEKSLERQLLLLALPNRQCQRKSYIALTPVGQL